MILSRTRAALVVAAAILAVAGIPTSAAASTVVERGCHETPLGYTCFYGPFEVGPSGWEKTKMVPAPNEAGYITYARGTLVDRHNEPLSRHMVHLHHAVWLNPVANDLTWPEIPERFFATGKERTAMDLPAGYGYYWSNGTNPGWPYYGKRGWGMTAHLMGMHGMTHKGVFIRLRLGFEGSSAALTPTRALWLDVNGSQTFDPTFDVAKGSGDNGRFKISDTLDAPVSGELIGAAGHLHDGGIRLTLRNATQNEHIFTSRALYEDDQRWFLTGMESWYDEQGVSIVEGDDLEVTAVYDDTHNWDDAMGIMLGAFVEAE